MRNSVPRSAGWAVASLLLGGLAPPTSALAAFTNFESHQVRPLALSADGQRLFALNTPDNRLSIFQVTAAGLVLEAEVPVGLEPVAVAPRTPTEVWVVNHLSDNVSIVDLTTMNVRATLYVGDEPTDVVFAGAAGRAFVCVSQEDAVKIIDPTNLAAPPVVVSIFGSDPRALATSPDGGRVYAAVFESGNLTSVLSEPEVVAGGGPPPPNPPMTPGLPAPPNVGLVIFWNGTHWVDESGTRNWEAIIPIPYTVVDNDLAVLDANSALPVPVYASGVGTLNFGVAVRPGTGQPYVTNFEAFNLTRFEPNLKGRFGHNRITIVDPVTLTAVPVHLNPHINYAVSPGPQFEIDASLSQPNGATWTAAGDRLYLAAVGSAKLGVVDPSGAVIARIDVGEGPTGVVLDEPRQRGYVLERFENRVGIVSLLTHTKIGDVSLGFQPEPSVVAHGRKFLYDARLSSAHGDLACASCHAFGNFDNLAWDLGDPTGAMQPSGVPFIPPFHPMKGPMTTQSLRGLAATEPFHWRGDRSDFNAFNPAFVGLMGRSTTLPAADMQAFTDFIMTVVYPPNPYQNPDRSYPDPAAPAASAERGRFEFTSQPHDGGLECQDCHDSSPADATHFVAPGTNGTIIPAQLLNESQAFKVPHLRNMYEKTGFEDAPGVQKRGFGFLHDGSIDNLFNFLLAPVFQFADDQQRRDMEAFMLALDTGMAPAVGVQQTANGVNNGHPDVDARITLLMARADVGDIDLVVKGRVGGVPRGYLYVGSGQFQSDGEADPLLTEATLRALAGPGTELTYTGVPPGNGERIGIDRDEDGYRDRHEVLAGSDPADPNSIPQASGVAEGAAPDTRRLAFLPAFPNPAGPAGTELSFTLASTMEASVRIFDAQGRAIATLLDNAPRQGTVTLRWSGRDEFGALVPSGVYFARIEAGGRTATRSVVITR